MESQSSVGKRIIWAVSMVVLCTFLTFFLSIFLENAFPDMLVAYRVGIPVLVFVALGVASFGMQNFFMPFLRGISIPYGLKKTVPVILIGLGIVLQQLYYDGEAKNVAVSEVYQVFAAGGKIYDATGFTFPGMYQGGLSIICLLFGYTVFAVSFYNRIYVILSAILLYFGIKNISGRTLPANVFLLVFLLSKQTLKLMVTPDASVIYLLMVSVFMFSVSLVYYYRTKTTNFIAQIVAVFIMGCLFTVLFVCESNSVIFALPAILVSFSGHNKQDKRWYYILAVEGMVLILIACAVVFILKPEIVLNYAFELPTISAVDLETTILLILNVLGFLGIYGMWSQKLYYIVPAVMSIYFVFAKADFLSGISGELSGFLCFALYAALGAGMLGNLSLEDEEEFVEEEIDEEEIHDKEDITSKESWSVEKMPVTAEEKEVQEEINTIKAMNEKLNQVESGFVPMTFKQPKRQEKKAVDYAYEPTLEEMKYDIEVSDNDDFDI